MFVHKIKNISFFKLWLYSFMIFPLKTTLVGGSTPASETLDRGAGEPTATWPRALQHCKNVTPDVDAVIGGSAAYPAGLQNNDKLR